MKVGFIIRSLSLMGPGVSPAAVVFVRGLNVISGPSDTGKTFIAQCVDYMLGSSRVPKSIPEAELYLTAQLEIEANATGQRYVLERAMRGGNTRLIGTADAARMLKSRHRGNETDTVSGFLLQLSGLDGKRVRTNNRGTTRALSFRDIAPLIVVDEESVISEASPIYSENVIDKTVEGGVFRLLLTGVDDSAVIAREDPKVVRGRQAGKVEVLDVLLGRLRDQVAERKIDVAVEEKRAQLERLERSVQQSQADVDLEQTSAAETEERRRHAWTQLREIESRLDVLSELQKRFVLLKAQYTSDLRRLATIAEAGLRLEQLREERCPVCGAAAEHHEVEHRRQQAAPADVAQASRAEAEKTAKLLRDLETTIAANGSEVARLEAERTARKTELSITSSAVAEQIQPRLQAAVQKLREGQTQRETVQRDISILEQLAELETLFREATATRKKEPTDFAPASVSGGPAERLSKEAEVLLRAWHFPKLDRVTFSDDAQDLVISGRPRSTHGKGVRAITRAAFNLAILRMCSREEKPFPGFVLIDSPLVVYREPESGEDEFPLEVKDAFYRSVAKEFLEAQVIVLENDNPPADVADSANVILFTGNATGRRGFIPE